MGFTSKLNLIQMNHLLRTLKFLQSCETNGNALGSHKIRDREGPQVRALASASASPAQKSVQTWGRPHGKPRMSTHSHQLTVSSQGPFPHHCSQTPYRRQAEEGKEGHSQVPPVFLVTLIWSSKQAEAQDSEDVHQDEEQDEHGGHSVECLPNGGDERLQGRGTGLGKAAGGGGAQGQRSSLPRPQLCPASSALSACGRYSANGWMERWRGKGREVGDRSGGGRGALPSLRAEPMPGLHSVIYGQIVCCLRSG